MMSHGFKINKYGKCVYVKDVEHGYVIICLYIDDMLNVMPRPKRVYGMCNCRVAYVHQ